MYVHIKEQSSFILTVYIVSLLSIKCSSIRLGDPVYGIVTKTVHKTLPGVVGAQGWVGIGLQG